MVFIKLLYFPTFTGYSFYSTHCTIHVNIKRNNISQISTTRRQDGARANKRSCRSTLARARSRQGFIAPLPTPLHHGNELTIHYYDRR